MKPQTEEQWLMVLAVIERLYAEVRAGNWDGLRQMLHGYATSPPEPRDELAAELLADDALLQKAIALYATENRDGGPWIEQGRRTRIAYLRRARASSPEPRGEDVADKLWKMCVEDGWPWSEGAIQDQLTELGLLYAKDMTAEDSGPECTNCEGDCRTCYRAVEHVRDAKPLPLPLTKGGAL